MRHTHVHQQREALEPLHRDGGGRLAPRQDLDRLGPGELAHRVIAADQPGERSPRAHGQLGRAKAGQLGLQRRRGHARIDRAQKGVGQQIEPLGTLGLELRHQLLHPVGRGLALGVGAEGALQQRHAAVLAGGARALDDGARVRLGAGVQHAELLQRAVALHDAQLHVERHHVHGAGHVAPWRLQALDDARTHRRCHEGEHHGNVVDEVLPVGVVVGTDHGQGDRGAPDVDEIGRQRARLLQDGRDAAHVLLHVAHGVAHLQPGLGQVGAKALVHISLTAEGDHQDVQGLAGQRGGRCSQRCQQGQAGAVQTVSKKAAA